MQYVGITWPCWLGFFLVEELNQRKKGTGNKGGKGITTQGTGEGPQIEDKRGRHILDWCYRCRRSGHFKSLPQTRKKPQPVPEDMRLRGPEIEEAPEKKQIDCSYGKKHNGGQELTRGTPPPLHNRPSNSWGENKHCCGLSLHPDHSE